MFSASSEKLSEFYNLASYDFLINKNKEKAGKLYRNWMKILNSN